MMTQQQVPQEEDLLMTQAGDTSGGRSDSGAGAVDW